MEYVYAAMLLHKAGQKIEEASLGRVLEAAGTKPDAARVKAVVSALEGVDIDQAVKEAAAAPQAAASPAPAAKAAEEKKPEKKAEEKKSEEEAAAGLGALFG